MALLARAPTNEPSSPASKSGLPGADTVVKAETANINCDALSDVGKCLNVENRVMILVLIAAKPGLTSTQLVNESLGRMSQQTVYSSIHKLAKAWLLFPIARLESDGLRTRTKISYGPSENALKFLDILGFSQQAANRWGFDEIRTFSIFVSHIMGCFRNEALVHTMTLLRQAGGSGMTRAELGQTLKISPDRASKYLRELSIAGLVRRSGGPEVRVNPDLIMVQLMDVMTSLTRAIEGRGYKDSANPPKKSRDSEPVRTLLDARGGNFRSVY